MLSRFCFIIYAENWVENVFCSEFTNFIVKKIRPIIFMFPFHFNLILASCLFIKPARIFVAFSRWKHTPIRLDSMPAQHMDMEFRNKFRKNMRIRACIASTAISVQTEEELQHCHA